jgi:hypothetical protein
MRRFAEVWKKLEWRSRDPRAENGIVLSMGSIYSSNPDRFYYLMVSIPTMPLKTS